MAMPRKLKNLNLFNDGNSYVGVVKSVTLPALGRKMEAYRGGGIRGYKNKAEVHVRPRWGDIQIDQIDHLDLQ